MSLAYHHYLFLYFLLSDNDECREDPQRCGPNAICNNQPGTFRCECEEGYQFGSDQRTCISKWFLCAVKCYYISGKPHLVLGR